MDNFSQISLGFVDETTTNPATPPVAREDQPVNIGVRIKKLKQVDNASATESKVKTTVTEMPSRETITPAQQAEPMPVAESAQPLATPPENIEVTAESNEEPADISVSESSSAGKIKSGRGRKSIRQIAEEADLIRIPEDEVLFQKQYYTMGEVAEMFRVNQSLLRFWEAEFDILQPKKNKKGDRYFRPADIKNLHLIYHLLRQRKYTIEGAKDFLRKGKKAEEKFEAIRKLEQIRDFLLEMKASLR